MIWYVLIVFFAGFFTGKFIKTEWVSKFKVVIILTMLLLFSLGLEIGANDELFKKINEIFIYALLIALFGSTGSFLFGYFSEKLFEKTGREK